MLKILNLLRIDYGSKYQCLKIGLNKFFILLYCKRGKKYDFIKIYVEILRKRVNKAKHSRTSAINFTFLLLLKLFAHCIAYVHYIQCRNKNRVVKIYILKHFLIVIQSPKTSKGLVKLRHCFHLVFKQYFPHL